MIAKANKYCPTVALQCFIANLSTGREYYMGAHSINYSELGQLWILLPEKNKKKQKERLYKKLCKK